MNNKLAVFDFDGTLVSTLESEAGKELYFKETGKQWMIENTSSAVENGFDPKFRRIGWWGRPETLVPPLLPRPLPANYLIQDTFKGYQKSKLDTNSFNVMVTGRHMKLAKLVEDILGELNLTFDEYYYKGHPKLTKLPTYPKDNNTPDYKVVAIRDHLMRQNTYTHLEIWEDREDVIDLFNTKLVSDLKDQQPQLEYIGIHDVKAIRDYHHPISACNVKVSLKLHG